MVHGSFEGRQDVGDLDLAARAKFRVTGADRFRFLNGQITNDVRKVSETAAIEACVLNAKGKINAHIFIVGMGEDFLIDAAPELREPLGGRLERYVIAEARLASYARELGDDPNIVERLTGAELAGRTYTPPFAYYLGRENAFRVVTAEFVTTTDGTGLVHTAGRRVRRDAGLRRQPPHQRPPQGGDAR